MSEHQELPQEKFRQWEALKQSRPSLIIEAASGAHGEGILSLTHEFRQGLYKDCRYLCIDPDPAVKANNGPDYSFGWMKSITDPDVTAKYMEQADEVWLRNIGSIINKKPWFEAIYQLMKPGAIAVLVDTQTSGLYLNEHDKYGAMFQEIGFAYVDLSTQYVKGEPAAHPYIDPSLRFRPPLPPAVILFMHKPIPESS